MINLKNYPSEWSLTPLQAKIPVRDNWNYEETLSRDTITKKYPNSNIGLRTGDISDGILAIDFDGNEGVKKLWDKIRGNNEDPITVSFSSNKAEGYHQRLYKIPDKYRGQFNGFTRKELKADVVNPETNKGEQLEFRYNSCQSVLPPSIHPDIHKPYTWINSTEDIAVADAPKWLIDFIINKYKLTTNNGKKEAINTGNEEISLYKCLSKDTRALIDKGVHEGGRNNTGFKIACDIVGTAKYIESNGLSYKEDPLELFNQYCDNCTPKLSSNEYQNIWKSANNSEREPVLSEDYINNCINAQLPKKSYTFNKPNISANEARKLVENLVEQNLKKSELEAKLVEISKASGIHVLNLQRQYDAIINECELEESNQDLKEKIDRLISLEKSCTSVELERFIPNKDLLFGLNFVRPILGSTNLALLAVFITCIGSRIHPNLYLNLIKASVFKARGNNIFTAIVGASGESKSPTINLFTDPLNKIQSEYNQEYDNALKKYENDLEAFNNLSKEEKKAAIECGCKPIKPIPKDCIINDSTIEQLLVILNNQPDEGILIHYDELSGLINSANRYKSKGNDREIILGFRDGKAPNVHRKNGTRLNSTKASVSIVGAITTDILMQQMEDGNDPSGHWARFIYAFIPRTKQVFPDDIPLNIDNILYLLYKRVYDITSVIVGDSDDFGVDLTYEAKQLYRGYFERIEAERYQEDNQAIRSYLSKSKRLAGELALILHIIFGIEKVKSDDIFPMEVGIDTVELSIELANIFTNQIRLIYAKLDNKEVSAVHKAILDYAQNKHKIKARDVQMSVWVLRDKSPDDIRKMFLELAELNYGVTHGKGSRLTFAVNKPNNVNNTQPVSPNNSCSTPVSTNTQADNTTDFNIGTGNNYSTKNFETNTQNSKKIFLL